MNVYELMTWAKAVDKHFEQRRGQRAHEERVYQKELREAKRDNEVDRVLKVLTFPRFWRWYWGRRRKQ